MHDIEEIIFNRNNENSNVSPSPEASNLTIAENVKKQYALTSVFSDDVANAHIDGSIHIHDLGYIDRAYCGSHSIEMIKKFGLNLSNGLSSTKPAKHPEVLIAHMVKFLTFMQTVFAGAVAYDAVNMFLAPFLVGYSDKERKQIAQLLIFELSQSAVARGGQAIFSDINLYWEIPSHFQDVPAIGPGGVFTGWTYKDYISESQAFAYALFDVFLEGDAKGCPFFFPKPLLHITPKFWNTPGHESFLSFVCSVSSKKGSPYFVFDRDEVRIAQCCRLKTSLSNQDLEDVKRPWRSRFCALQNVTINLPRIAYECEDMDDFYDILDERFHIVKKAHKQKCNFIRKLLDMGTSGPLSLLSSMIDGERYLRLDRASYLVGIIGLDEAVETLSGSKMHENDSSLALGLEIIAEMKLMTEFRNSCERNLQYPINMSLEQTPAESATLRLASMDLKKYYDKASLVVKGDQKSGSVYYTNSTQLNVGADIDPITRIKKESLFHPLITAGAITHIWIGESEPSPASLAALVKKTYEYSKSEQIAFSPEFTICNNCNNLMRGLSSICVSCGSEDVDSITRITGYFSKLSSWNKGKIQELKDRNKDIIMEIK